MCIRDRSWDGTFITALHKFDPKDNQTRMGIAPTHILDKSISEIRIVLLVQIGKEGWDCRSLTGIILSQEGDCPTNMAVSYTHLDVYKRQQLVL